MVAAALGNGAIALLRPEAPPGQRRAVLLADAHASAVVAVGWVRLRDVEGGAAERAAQDEARHYLFSAGNDGWLRVWDVAQPADAVWSAEEPAAARGGVGDDNAGEASGGNGEGAGATAVGGVGGGSDGSGGGAGGGDAPAPARLVWRIRHGRRGPNWVTPIDCHPCASMSGGGTARERGGLLVCDTSSVVRLYAW